MARRGETISIAITTYNRPDGCLRLLRDIHREANASKFRVRVAVFDDASTEDYGEVRGFLRTQGWQWHRMPENGGKRGYWKVVNAVLNRWANDASPYFYFLQDDIRLCDSFFERTVGLWGQIGHANKATLYLLRDSDRDQVGVACWTKFKSRVEGVVERTQWCDCAAFMAGRGFIEGLNGKLDPVGDARWQADPKLSSGVGSQISLRLNHRKYAMFRALHSYVLHIDGNVSKMNPDKRKECPMRAVRFIDGPDAESAILSEYDQVTASLATIPSRRSSLAKVVSRLLPQVDRLNVYLNENPRIVGGDGYPHLPEFLRHPKITTVWSRDTEFGDMGDAGKFYWASEVQGWHIVCDDDVLYPPDFVDKLITGAERYGKRCAVGLHGAILTEPFGAYYGSRRTFHFTRELPKDTSVHILASNSLCYHTSTIRVHRDDFKHPNMGDIWFALLAQQQRVPLVCLKHARGWIKDDKTTRGDSIYAHSKKKVSGSRKNTADKQTEVVRLNMPWRVFSPSGRVIHSIGQAPAPQVSSRRRRLRAAAANARLAAFLVPTTNRPLLLASVLRSLMLQEAVPGWDVEILVGGPADDPGRVMAELAGARYIEAEGTTPGHKINAMMAATKAELLMLADDDDLQSPWRAQAAIKAHTEGYGWSSGGRWYCVDQRSGKAVVWEGKASLVGTLVSAKASVAKAAGGWPEIPSGKDGIFASRLRRAKFKDITDDLRMGTVQLQHSKNIHRRRPFPEEGVTVRCGRFNVTGCGGLAALEPHLPATTIRLARALVQKDNT